MLAGWRAFPVIARDSTFTFKGKAVDIKKVGGQLAARYIVEASVRKSGHRVRITAQLIRADTGHHMMAERFDRDLTDLFELQDEITRIIAGALEPDSSNSNATASPTTRSTMRMPMGSTSAACTIITGRTRRTTSRHRPISGAV